MDWGGPTFVVLLVAISTGGWLINNWIRAKHGYSLENEWGGMTDLMGSGESDAEAKRLKAENRELNDKLDAMQDRMIVLEKIVTDRGYSLSDEIEALRDKPTPLRNDESGISLNINSKEKQQ